MLSSSDAKFRCLWHLCVWSILLTLVSQFLNVIDHIAFYIFGFLSVTLLPVITSIYCNSSGKKGVRLLRVIYVLADPVLSCVTITPVLLMQHLPETLDQYYCLNTFTTWNQTLQCLKNQSVPFNFIEGDIYASLQLTKFRILVIESCIMLPVLVSLVMGRRTTKMAYATDALNFAYWVIVAIEAACLVETALFDHRYIHMVFTTEITISIVIVVANSYGLVTLVSFISPVSASLRKKYNTKFDLVFKVIIGISAVCFAEVPFIIARFRILILDLSVMLPGNFYLWAVKDLIFVFLIVFVLGIKKLGQTYTRTCAPITKNKTYFQPEKRDVYHAKRVKFQMREQETSSITGSYTFVMKNGKFSLIKKEEPSSIADIEDGLEQKMVCGLSTVHEEDEGIDTPKSSSHENFLPSVSSEKNLEVDDPVPCKGIFQMYNINRQQEARKNNALPIPQYDIDSSTDSLDGHCLTSSCEEIEMKELNHNRKQVVVATIEKEVPILDSEDPDDMEVRLINQQLPVHHQYGSV